MFKVANWALAVIVFDIRDHIFRVEKTNEFLAQIFTSGSLLLFFNFGGVFKVSA